jgi:hypothetical protein
MPKRWTAAIVGTESGRVIEIGFVRFKRFADAAEWVATQNAKSDSDLTRYEVKAIPSVWREQVVLAPEGHPKYAHRLQHVLTAWICHRKGHVPFREGAFCARCALGLDQEKLRQLDIDWIGTWYE